jgi:hypothetical protein
MKKVLFPLLTVALAAATLGCCTSVTPKFDVNTPALEVDAYVRATYPRAYLQVAQYDFEQSLTGLTAAKYVYNVFTADYYDFEGALELNLTTTPTEPNLVKHDGCWNETVAVTVAGIPAVTDVVPYIKEHYGDNLPDIRRITLVHPLNVFENPEPLYQVYAYQDGGHHFIGTLTVYSNQFTDIAKAEK